tara:strand:+ start:1173 stop:1496 length:324 start_codon:yes stop_codon:yes gene_type:complete
MENQNDTNITDQADTSEYLGAFNLNQETVQAAITDFTLKNSVELQEVVQQAEANDQSVKVQVRWHTEGSFAEIHLFRVETTDTEDVDTDEESIDIVEADPVEATEDE